MTARSFLVRGLLAGLIAGFAAFLVAHQVGEPSVERAIALEEAGAVHADSAHSHGDDEDGHSHGADDGSGATVDAEVSRGTQRTWGLLTGTVGVGVALGGIVSLVSAGVAGRMGRLRPAASTAVVALVGFVAFALVPFVKYPANPPAVGSGDTIGSRTGLYFAFLLISLVTAVLATALALRVAGRVTPYAGVVAGAASYLVIVVAAGLLLPTVNELGDTPADLVWSFRLSSLLTLATLWAVIGVALVGLVGRLDSQASSVAARRELAASL